MSRCDAPNLDPGRLVGRFVRDRQRYRLPWDEMSTPPLRLLWLGQSGLKYPNARTTPIHSKETVLDFDVVIWSVRGLGSEFGQGGVRPVSMTEDQMLFCRQEVWRRGHEFSELLEHGRALVVLPDHFGSIFINRETAPFKHAEAELPIIMRLPNTAPSEGQRIEARGSAAFQTFVEQNEGHLTFNATVKLRDEFTPTLFIKGTDECVGGYVVGDNGSVVLYLPYLIEGPPSTSARYALSIVELIETLRSTPDAVSIALPTWTEPYLLPRETDLDDQISELNTQIKGLYEKRGKIASEASSLKQWKHLFASDGRKLEAAVDQALSTLGFEVELGKPGRSDLVARRAKKPMVVEVKGYKNGAKEGQVWTQLHRWENDYIQEHGERPKGLGVINTFRDTPIDERTGTHWPSKLIQACEQDHYALATGVQLLNMAFAAEADPSKQDQIAQFLFDSDGPVNGYEAWDMYVTKTDTQDGETPE